MKFDIVVCTYNRSASIIKLVKEIISFDSEACQIIVVDSSDEINEELPLLSNVKYVRSSHKNQPYQRCLGYLLATQEWIVFMDDDLIFLEGDFFKDISKKIKNHDITGISVGIDYQNIIQQKVDTGYNSSSIFFKLINFLSGVPFRKPGQMYYAGLAGGLPDVEGNVQYFNGPLMVFKRASLVNSFDFVLFSLFEKHLAMGEDKAISMSVGLRNTLLYLPKKYFKHPPLESHYFSDFRSFQRKIGYSRLYLSLRYSRVKNMKVFWAYLHYYYFTSWRILIGLGRMLMRPSTQNIQLFKGQVDALFLTFIKPFKTESLTPNIDWQKELNDDVRCARQ